MSNEVLFRTQLASIMEVLANAAVEEICKLVDEGYAVLHLQMSEYQKENDALKMRLHFMELRAAHESAERASALEIPLDKHMDGAPTLREKSRGTIKESPTVALGSGEDVGVEGLVPVVNEGNPSATFSLKQVGASEVDSLQSEIILIKEETPEEFSEPQTDLKSPARGALDSGAADEAGVATPGLRVSSAERSKQLSVPHRSGVWECTGVGEGRTGSILLKEERVEEGRETRREMNSTEERVRKLGGVPSPAVEKPVSDTTAAECSRNCPSSFEPLHARPEAAAVDPALAVMGGVASSAWSDSITSRLAHSQNTHHGGRRQRETDLSVLHTQTGLKEKATLVNPDPVGTKRFQPFHKSFLESRGPAASLRRGVGDQERFLCKYCGKGFRFAAKLRVHHRVHTGEKPYRCSHCGRSFSQSCSLTRHLNVHTGYKPFSCTYCGKGYTNKRSLHTHLAAHRGERFGS